MVLDVLCRVKNPSKNHSRSYKVRGEAHHTEILQQNGAEKYPTGDTVQGHQLLGPCQLEIRHSNRGHTDPLRGSQAGWHRLDKFSPLAASLRVSEW